jgi:hypothetical protein
VNGGADAHGHLHVRFGRGHFPMAREDAAIEVRNA